MTFSLLLNLLADNKPEISAAALIVFDGLQYSSSARFQQKEQFLYTFVLFV